MPFLLFGVVPGARKAALANESSFPHKRLDYIRCKGITLKRALYHLESGTPNAGSLMARMALSGGP
ncbi:MAG: hypothetical protein KJ052_13740, partial [Candidatus Hydrogenedentes bacterium]|nr:hypothetical protein [Candidatus Hydrogenedentota bacterium]